MKIKNKNFEDMKKDWNNNNFVLHIPEGSGSRNGEKV